MRVIGDDLAPGAEAAVSGVESTEKAKAFEISEKAKPAGVPLREVPKTDS
jgi:hypothetical protein